MIESSGWKYLADLHSLSIVWSSHTLSKHEDYALGSNEEELAWIARSNSIMHGLDAHSLAVRACQLRSPHPVILTTTKIRCQLASGAYYDHGEYYHWPGMQKLGAWAVGKSHLARETATSPAESPPLHIEFGVRKVFAERHAGVTHLKSPLPPRSPGRRFQEKRGAHSC